MIRFLLLAPDSKGNLYMTETCEGKRLQKFIHQGMRTVTERDQGVPWPHSARGSALR